MERLRRSIIFVILAILSIQLTYASYQWSRQDDPSLLISGYEKKMSALPKGGKLNKKPWSGDYWATYRGGISYRWLHKTNKVKYKFEDPSKLTQNQIRGLSPAEKFDLYKGDSNWTLTKLERDRTQVMSNKKIERWWGLCHAWAPATILYDSPNMIQVKGKHGHIIPFYASDMKALLTYNLHLFGGQTKTYFMGSRCNVSLPWYLKLLTLDLLSEDQYLSMVRDENCNDMDPGAVHLAFSNLLGLKKLGFVMDKTRGSEIWNQGIYAFKSTVEKTSKKRKLTWRGLKVIGKVHKIRTRVTWVNEIRHTMKRVSPDNGLRTLTYKYEIYTDNTGDIIGGKWLQKIRPDFFWRIEDPGIHSMMVGLGDLYTKSIADISQGPKRIRTRPELFNLFKRTAKQVRNSQTFIRNTRQLIASRKSQRQEYYKELKGYYLKNYKMLMQKYR
ncbi:MAG: hypothetical protein DRQ89_08555 [Epsilonproteobacteria bacterium]|nr:MAG: hypothetical protein DRQ89_08555 [Campylobacterota bacterium]